MTNAEQAIIAEHAGAVELFWGVALRPGRPTWFGTHDRGARERKTLVFGLPGNPVSAVVTFLLFVRPAIRLLSGADPARDRLAAVLDDGYSKQPGRTHAVRCRLELRGDGWHARTTGPQGSHVLTSMLGAEGLGIVPSASDGLAAGERIEVGVAGGRLRVGRDLTESVFRYVVRDELHPGP